MTSTDTLKNHLKTILTSFVSENAMGFHIKEKTYMFYLGYGQNANTTMESDVWTMKSFEKVPIDILQTVYEWKRGDNFDNLQIFLYPHIFSYMYYQWHEKYHRKHHNRKRSRNDELFSFKTYARRVVMEFIQKILTDSEFDDTFVPFQWQLFGNVAIKIDPYLETIEYYDLRANKKIKESDLFDENQSRKLPSEYYNNGEFRYNEKDGVVELFIDGANNGVVTEYDFYNTIFDEIGKEFRPTKK